MRFIDGLRTGSWVTAERVRLYSATMLAATGCAIAALLLTRSGSDDMLGRPLGTDFSGLWVAGRAVLAGYPAQPYDHAAHAAAQAATFGLSDFFLPWPYPPYLLALAAGLATMPYLAALAVWQGATLALYLGAVRLAIRSGDAIGARIRDRDVLLVAAAFPGVALNALHGQNGCFTAALLATGALLVPSRPLLAGLCLGLLAYKPQFAPMIPLALVAGRQWQATGAAAATVAAMTLASLWAYGLAPWAAFFANLDWMRHVVLEGGGLPSHKLISAFAAVRLIGGSCLSAYVAQALVVAMAAASMGAIWFWREERGLAFASLATATLLASPYCVDYDLTVLGPVIAVLVALGLAQGFAPFEKSLLAVVWALPIAVRPIALTTHLPLGFLAVAALHGTIVLRALRRRAAPVLHVGPAPLASL